MTHEQEQLILNNLDYAKALHHKFCNEHEIKDRDDYLQQANLGLVEASLKYKKGSAKFTTFAYYSMENNMSRFLKRNKVNLEYNNDITGEYDTQLDAMEDDLEMSQLITKVVKIAPLYLKETEVIMLQMALVLLMEGETKEYVMKMLKVKRYTFTKILKVGANIIETLRKKEVTL